MENKVLVHHGIKGQKWGVRRYQNEDGTLTAEGRKRYGADEPKPPKKPSTKMIDYQNVSNDELRKVVDRIELENRYLRAIDARKGKSFLQTVADTSSKIGTILENTNKTIQFFTGKNFAQNADLLKTKFKDLSKEEGDEAIGNFAKDLGKDINKAMGGSSGSSKKKKNKKNKNKSSDNGRKVYEGTVEDTAYDDSYALVPFRYR